jgi:hypothetical protein
MSLIIATSAMKINIKDSIMTSMKSKFPLLDQNDANGNPKSSQLKEFIDSIADGVVDGIIDGILANAVITVTSVTGVTTGVAISGPGTGTIT